MKIYPEKIDEEEDKGNFENEKEKKEIILEKAEIAPNPARPI